jgi:hypothetical protein
MFFFFQTEKDDAQEEHWILDYLTESCVSLPRTRSCFILRGFALVV